VEELTPTSVPATATTSNIGETIQFPDGSSVRLILIEEPDPETFAVLADLRKQPIVTEVERCASPTMPAEDTLLVNALNWQLVAANSRWYTPILGGVSPEITVQVVGTGECVRGWLTFTVPKGVVFSRLLFSGFAYDGTVQKARWSIPDGTLGQ